MFAQRSIGRMDEITWMDCMAISVVWHGNYLYDDLTEFGKIVCDLMLAGF